MRHWHRACAEVHDLVNANQTRTREDQRRDHGDNMLQRIAFGLAAGAVATTVMDWSQETVIPAASGWIEGKLHRESSNSNTASDGSESEGSPARVARRLADALGVDLTHERAMELGNRIHWAYGTQFGLPFEVSPVRHSPLTGAAYGALLWLGSDELLLWAIGIAGKPTQYPISTHVKALAAHTVYGAALGATTWGLETVFQRKSDLPVNA